MDPIFGFGGQSEHQLPIIVLMKTQVEPFQNPFRFYALMGA